MKSPAFDRLGDFDANRLGSTGRRIFRNRLSPRTEVVYSEMRYTSLGSDKRRLDRGTEISRELMTENADVERLSSKSR
ncbi:uncharacterized protein HfgLR_08210 [Haloferax gibbonsii]|uniref:Uncharacterized protein n=1 Tax=Haloferax gibbonsii TaxID=35746 RepID=A0A871BGJ0_HALGI|nr:uncharacterized protein HfgLR_08210 [Haloferax gibbonsii]